MAAIGVLYMANTVHTYVHFPLHANHVYQKANSWFHLFSLVKILCTVFVGVYCVRVLGWSDFRKKKIGHLASCANCFFYPNSKSSHFIVALQLEEGLRQGGMALGFLKMKILRNGRARSNSPFLWYWTHKNITNRQRSARFRNRKKCYITPPYCTVCPDSQEK